MLYVAAGVKTTMRYKLTKETLPRINELCLLIATTRGGLRDLSVEALREWDRLRFRFPSNDDLCQGFVSLSDVELADLHASLVRFRERTVPLAPAVTWHPRLSERSLRAVA